jgi:hypothetical protein
MDKFEVISGFDPMQVELLAALRELNSEAANIYVGAISTFRTEWNLDRIALCSHGIRELINKLPLYADVPLVKEDRQKLGNYADNLVAVWNKMAEKKIWPGEPAWSGSIDADLRKVLKKTQLLVESHIKIKAGRKLQVRKIIQKHNYHPVPLPASIEENKASQWDEYRTYFANVAHHARTSEEEFKSHLTHFEDMLLNYLKPRTFDKKAEILKLIKDGAKDAE